MKTLAIFILSYLFFFIIFSLTILNWLYVKETRKVRKDLNMTFPKGIKNLLSFNLITSGAISLVAVILLILILLFR